MPGEIKNHLYFENIGVKKRKNVLFFESSKYQAFGLVNNQYRANGFGSTPEKAILSFIKKAVEEFISETEFVLTRK